MVWLELHQRANELHVDVHSYPFTRCDSFLQLYNSLILCLCPPPPLKISQKGLLSHWIKVYFVVHYLACTFDVILFLYIKFLKDDWFINSIDCTCYLERCLLRCFIAKKGRHFKYIRLLLIEDNSAAEEIEDGKTAEILTTREENAIQKWEYIFLKR